MAFDINELIAESNREFADSARGLLQSESTMARLRRLRDSSPGFERHMWTKLAEAGWSSAFIPEQRGGLGLALDAAAAIATVIGEMPIPEPYIAAAVMPAVALLELDASELVNDLLLRIAQGELICALAWQEKAGQLNAGDTATCVTAEGAQLRLTGTKKWVSPGDGVDGWLVHGRQGDDAVLVWVDCRDEGVIMQRVRRIDGSFMANLTFDVTLPRERIVARGRAVIPALDKALDAGRFVASHELLGGAAHVFNMTLQYLQTREQFGKPIGANQALQHRMVDAYMHILLLSASLKETWVAYCKGDLSLSVVASLVKTRANQVAVSVSRLAVQLHGAIGYTDELDVGIYLKRALHLSAWLGNEDRHRLRYIGEQLSVGDDCIERDGSGETDAVPATDQHEDLNAMPDRDFARMVRTFLVDYYPSSLRHVARRLYWSEVKDWYRLLSDKGWLAPAWPKAHGGMGLTPEKQLIFFEEMENYGVARLPDQGIINLGPVLIKHGTTAQQQTYLPKILSGEHIWCQGYSEPGAGSDLASLKTEAIADGDDFIVNGQKIWTTLAHNATHIFALVRTDKTVRKQAGISFLLIDLSSPGITVSPITNLLGDQEFCEVFFDNVRVPQANLVGRLNEGWTIAKALLGFERIFAGSPQQSRHAFSILTTLARKENLFATEYFLQCYAQLRMDIADLESLFSMFAGYVKNGKDLPPSISLLKIWATETYTKIGLQLARAADENGGQFDDTHYEDNTVINSLAPFTHSLVTTIYGGTNEIQRNIVARHVLNLPV